MPDAVIYKPCGNRRATVCSHCSMRRAGGALAFADPDHPAVQELRALYEAVAPLILSDRIAR